MTRLGDGGNECLLGTVVSVADVALAELVAAPFDVVWIDLEHGALSVRDAQAIAIAVQSAGCAALVRVPHWSSDLLAAVLDAGLDGIVAPNVEREDEARELVARMRYPPAGLRGFGPRRAGGFGRTPAFWSSPSARPMCVAQIESEAGVEAAPAIAAVEGIDALVVGCADLSFSLGAPQDLQAPSMRQAVQRVRQAAQEAGAMFGVAGSGDPGALCRLAAGAAQMIVYSADVRIYAQAVDAVAAALDAALGTREQEEHHVSA